MLMHSTSAMRPPGKGAIRKVIPTPEKEAASAVYRIPDSDQLYVPANALKASILDACRGLRLGKMAAKGVMEGAIFELAEYCPLIYPSGNGKSGKPIETYEIDTRRVVVQKAGIMRSRAKIPAWETTVEFDWDQEAVSAENVEHFFKRAGRVIGVLEYRPKPATPGGNGGPFGRYTVERL